MLVVSFAHAAGGENIVVNGGFESGAASWKSGSLPDGWSMDKAETLTPGELAIDTRVRHSGTASIRLADSTHGLYQRFNVKPGELYNARFWAKSQLTAGGFGIHIAWLDAQGKWVTNAKGHQITHGGNVYAINDWREVRIDNIRAPATAAIAQLTLISIIEVDHQVVEGEYWIDDISMETAPADHSKGENHATARIQAAASTPTVDGVLDDPVWARSTEIGSFTLPAVRTVALSQTSAVVTYDDGALYLGIVSLNPRPAASGDKDTIDIILQRKQFSFNADGVRTSAASPSDDWQVAVQTGEKAWTAEVK
ncbi:MAG: hypothetical protein IT582_09470, partial [Opitutaceae bacterium]|nr:hypothetical protein [Opitutaceae bacterium]